MAVSFKNIKSTVLDMTDKITVGKLQGCRVCDVIEDHYEYLIWADKQGLLKFKAIVIETIKEQANFRNWTADQEEAKAIVAANPWFTPDEDDVPF